MSIDVDIRNIRKDYTKNILDESSLLENPLDLFIIWLNEAITYELKEPNAMALSTVFNNKPKTRIVLLKQILKEKFIFFTNYNSNKSKEIEKNPYISLTFFWEEMQRQVRIEGIATKTSEIISDEYFSMRNRESQIAAWVSNQSEEVTKEELENRLIIFNEKFKDISIPRPNHWGAYEVNPTLIEFWQGGPNRLHNRFVYEKNSSIWSKKRIAP